MVNSSCLSPMALVILQLLSSDVANSFTIPSAPTFATSRQQAVTVAAPTATTLYAEKQTRSTLIKPQNKKVTPKSKSTSTTTATIETPTVEKTEEHEEIFGAKFFGGSAIKEELYDEAVEAQAGKIASLYPPKPKASKKVDMKDKVNQIEEKDDDDDDVSRGYKRFMDENAFDDVGRAIAQRLQTAINQELYIAENEDEEDVIHQGQVYAPNLKWNTPLGRSKDSKNPLQELANALDFYKRVDIAVISAKAIGDVNENDKVQTIEMRWEISAVWPNTWESRVLVTGTSALTVDKDSGTILSQADKLDMGGKDGQDAVGAISPQVQPRFWDLYHIGMTPSAELMPRVKPSSGAGKGAFSFSKYDVFEIPPRLVYQPTIEDLEGRAARTAESLPNDAFSCSIKTNGPFEQRYVTTSPVEVKIRRSEEKSILSWNVPVPAEFVSYYDELPVGNEDDDDAGESISQYSYESRRLVATLPFGGSAQDKEVSDIRKQLYEQVTKDGLKPKLVDGRPQFFFLNYDAKACFVADGGLGMAVYEWRPEFSNSNEVGIELAL